MYRDCVLKCFYKTFFGIFVYIWKSIWKVGFDWASWIRSKNGDSADFGRYRPVSVNFGLNRLESARVGVNLKKKKRRISASEERRCVATSPVWVRHPFCSVGALETLEWILKYIYIYIYCIAENEWDEFKITKYSWENPIFDAEQIRMFLFHLFCTSCLI